MGLPAARRVEQQQRMGEALARASRLPAASRGLHARRREGGETGAGPVPARLIAAGRASRVDCLVFEDSPNGLKAAPAAGMWAVAVPNALTRPLELPPHDLVLDSLASHTLAALRDALEGQAAPRN